ncbi:MAG: Xaa-Pro dipeptidase [Acidobacteria bacterium]|nr:Xaa-Pro dipeptidase [Acidobacteriota bacterium]
MDLRTLFSEHLAERLAWASRALADTGYEALVISSGQPYTHFADDQEAPFRSTPHFVHHCPLRGPHHVLKVEAGKRPLLIRYAPEDFWYEQLPLAALWGGEPFWLASFDLVECATLDAVWETLGKPSRAAYIGNETDRAGAAGLDPNPASITAFLDWGRSFKSAYEVRCMEEATVLGARGHSAGRAAFLAGASELEIHHAFAQAVGCLDHDLAFASIVALNEKGATLHYEGKRTFRNGKTLLLDCGANVRGYASDITRTTPGPGCDPRFAALVVGMEKLQQELCAEVKPGLSFGALHHSSHLKIGALLQSAGILKAGPEEAIAKGLTRAFYPHGLGHHLGLQVHDVAGKLAGPGGDLQPPPPEHPYLRTTRTIEPRQVFTIEPGLYFIPMLLRPFRGNEHAALFDWKLIDELIPCGGIRIEDNILVTEHGGRNLTREQLPT